MKKLLIVVMLLLMVSSALAVTPVDKFLGIRYKYDYSDQMKITANCTDDKFFDSYLPRLNNNTVVLEAITTFEDGYHIIHIEGDDFKEFEYITILKENGYIKSAGLGVCTPDYKYRLYDIRINLDKIQRLSDDKDNVGLVVETYTTFKGIVGITLNQKLHILKTLMKYGFAGLEPLRII